MWFSFISCSSWYDRKNETCSQKSILQGYFHRSLKTFNCICNHILITQLNAYEFDRNKLKLINDCLNGRSQKNKEFFVMSKDLHLDFCCSTWIYFLWTTDLAHSANLLMPVVTNEDQHLMKSYATSK